MTLKKLMMYAAALVCTFAANAACVDWKVTGAAATANYQVFLVSAIDDSWTGVSDLAAASAALGTGGSGTIMKNGRSYLTLGQIYGDNVTAESAKGFYWVIVSGADAKDYNYVAVDGSSKVYAPPASSPGNLSINASDILAGTKGSFAAVPEPTSGLLALLGFAGLALRRRRA